jgi:cell division protein FtsL
VLAGAGAVAVVIAFGLVYLHVIAAQRQFTLDRLNNQVTQQEATYQRLRLQVAQLDAPSRIISYAEATLGMQEPSSVTYLNAPPGQGATAPTTTTPTQAPSGDDNWPEIKSLMAGTP